MWLKLWKSSKESFLRQEVMLSFLCLPHMRSHLKRPLDRANLTGLGWVPQTPSKLGLCLSANNPYLSDGGGGTSLYLRQGTTFHTFLILALEWKRTDSQSGFTMAADSPKSKKSVSENQWLWQPVTFTEIHRWQGLPSYLRTKRTNKKNTCRRLKCFLLACSWVQPEELLALLLSKALFLGQNIL